MWKLKKKGANCNVSKGELFVPSKQKGSKTLITVSGETRSTIKQVICKLYSYDNVSEKICFIAKKTNYKHSYPIWSGYKKRCTVCEVI